MKLFKYLLIICCLPILMGNALQAQEVPAEKESDLKILSWNIYMLPFIIFKKSKKKKRALAIGDTLAQSNYDIIVFQEAFKKNIRWQLRKKLRQAYPYVYGPANKRPFSFRTNSGIYVFSNRPLIEKGTVQFDACSGHDCKSRKGALMLEGENEGHLFQIVGTHTNGGREINRHQFHQIRDELLDVHYQEGVPQIIVGDMNCSKGTEEYPKMLRIFDAVDEPWYGDRRHSNYEKSKIIDYALLRENESVVAVINREVLRFGPAWSPVKKERPTSVGQTGQLSDHFPVELILRFD